MPEIFFITNRNPLPSNDAATDFGPFFNERGPGYLRLGRAVLDDPKPNKPLPEDLKVQQLEVYPDDPFANPPVLGSVPFLEALEQRVFDPQQRQDCSVSSSSRRWKSSGAAMLFETVLPKRSAAAFRT